MEDFKERQILVPIPYASWSFAMLMTCVSPVGVVMMSHMPCILACNFAHPGAFDANTTPCVPQGAPKPVWDRHAVVI